MQLAKRSEDQDKLVDMIREYLAIAGGVVEQTLDNLDIDEGRLHDIVREGRVKIREADPKNGVFLEQNALQTRLVEYLASNLPLFGSPDWFADESRVPFYDELSRLERIRLDIVMSLEDHRLANFVGHDLNQVRSDSFLPLFNTGPNGYVDHFIAEGQEVDLDMSIKEYEHNCRQSLDIVSFPFEFLLELATGESRSTFTPREMADKVGAALKNRFCHITHGGGVEIVNNIPEDIELTRNHLSYLSFIQNTLKNALYRAENLCGYSNEDQERYGLPPLNHDLKYRIEFSVVERGDGVSTLVCSQNFPGPDLYNLLARGGELVESGHETTLDLESVQRYKRWVADELGMPFLDLTFGDAVEIMFEEGMTLSEYPVASSGTGLFAVRNIHGGIVGGRVGCCYDKERIFKFFMDMPDAA